MFCSLVVSPTPHVAFKYGSTTCERLRWRIRVLTLSLSRAGHICVTRQQFPLAAAAGPCGHPARWVISHRVPGDCSSAVPGSAVWFDTR